MDLTKLIDLLQARDCDGFAVIRQTPRGQYIAAGVKAGAFANPRSWSSYDTPDAAVADLYTQAGGVPSDDFTCEESRIDHASKTPAELKEEAAERALHADIQAALDFGKTADQHLR